MQAVLSSEQSSRPDGQTNPLSDNRAIALGFALIIGMQIYLIFVQGINWDEFLYLSRIYELKSGTMHLVVQTIHTRLFYWLTWIPGGEIAQLRVARFVMLGCELVTATCIAFIAAKFTSRKAGLIMALAYLGGGFVFYHGTSFRADPIAAALLMFASLLMFRQKYNVLTVSATAFLIALAAMVTVKSVFYAPVFLGIGLMRILQTDQRLKIMATLSATAVAAVVIFIILYIVHDSLLPNADSANDSAMLGSAANTVFQAQLFPRLDFLIGQVAFAPVLTLLMLGTFALLFFRKRNGLTGQYWALAGLILPILTIVFYRNAFAYYYAFILPPVLAALSVGLLPILERYGAKAIVCLTAINAGWLFWDIPKTVQADQKSVIETVHEIFPEPVPYIDRSSMIGSFPKKGFFMSSWGMNRYLENGSPVFKELIAEQEPVFVLGNHPALTAALTGQNFDGPALLEADAEILRANYAQFWGPVWVHRKYIESGQIRKPRQSAPDGPIFLEFFH